MKISNIYYFLVPVNMILLLTDGAIKETSCTTTLQKQTTHSLVPKMAQTLQSLFSVSHETI